MPTLLDIGPNVFQRGSRIAAISPFPNMIDQENVQQYTKIKNYKQPQKIGQCSLEYHNHSPVFITIFLTQAKTLSQYCRVTFLPVGKSSF